jgi:hypothetical protein
MYVALSEEILSQMQITIGEQPHVAFMFDCIKQFADAGLQPVVLYNTLTTEIYVTSYERLTKKLH